MKTILVVYTNVKINDDKALRNMQQYAFNINIYTLDNDIAVGDLIKSSAYKTAMQVVAVLDLSYTYYHETTGDLVNKITSTKHKQIAFIELRAEKDEVVYGSIVKVNDTLEVKPFNVGALD